jgi:MFS family permease
MGIPPVRSDLRKSFVDGAAYMVMVALGENLFPLFALAIGLSQLDAGLVVAIPLLLGALSQTVTPAVVRRLGSFRRYVVLASLVQALTFLPLVAGAFLGGLPRVALYACAGLYHAANFAAGPAWVTWMGWLVPGPLRARYFARRSRGVYTALVAGMLLAGLVLHRGDAWGRALPAFGILFALAAAARIVCVVVLARQSEPSPIPFLPPRVSLLPLARRLLAGTEGRLILYLVAVQGATYVALPFLPPFFRERLGFDYAQILVLQAVPFAARVAVFPLLGDIARSRGALRVLWLGGIGLVPIPLLWSLLSSFPLLMAVQAVGGALWAGFELGGFLLYFEALGERERTSLLTAYNLLTGIAIVAGGLLGALVLAAGGQSEGTYRLLFALSTPLRALPLLLLARAASAPSARR